MEEGKSNKGTKAILIGIIIILLLVIVYLLFGKNYISNYIKPNNDTNTNTNVETNNNTPTVTPVEKPAELNNATIEEFYDTVTNQKYYLATFVLESDGDIYDATKHVIYDSNYKEVAIIPELSTSHVWTKGGESMFGAGNPITLTAILNSNKIYSIAKDPNSQCDFVEYESYIENGELKQSIIKNIKDTEVNISGEQC